MVDESKFSSNWVQEKFICNSCLQDIGRIWKPLLMTLFEKVFSKGEVKMLITNPTLLYGMILNLETQV